MLSVLTRPLPTRLVDPTLLFATTAAAIWALCLALISVLPGFDNPGLIAISVTFDLTLSITALAWLGPVRTGRWPARALVPVFLLSLAAARRVVPFEGEVALRLLGWAGVAAEVALIVWIAATLRRARRQALGAPPAGLADGDLLTRATEICRHVVGIPSAASALAFEIAVLGYAFGAGGPSPAGAAAEARVFTYHRKAAYGSVVVGLSFVILAEALPLHYALQRWNGTAAWILTALGLYTLVYLLADYRAAIRRPVLLGAESLLIRIGVRWTIEVPRQAILAVHRRVPRPNAGARPLRASLVGAANVWLDLRAPVTAVGPYGRTRRVTKIALGVDEPDRLAAELAG